MILPSAPITSEIAVISARTSLPLTLTPDVGEPVPSPVLNVKLPSTSFFTALNISCSEAFAGTEHTRVSHPDSAAVGQYLNNSRVTVSSALSIVPGAKSPDTSSSSPLVP